METIYTLVFHGSSPAQCLLYTMGNSQSKVNLSKFCRAVCTLPFPMSFIWGKFPTGGEGNGGRRHSATVLPAYINAIPVRGKLGFPSPSTHKRTGIFHLARHLPRRLSRQTDIETAAQMSVPWRHVCHKSAIYPCLINTCVPGPLSTGVHPLHWGNRQLTMLMIIGYLPCKILWWSIGEQLWFLQEHWQCRTPGQWMAGSYIHLSSIFNPLALTLSPTFSLHYTRLKKNNKACSIKV